MKINYFQNGGSSIPAKGSKINMHPSLLKPQPQPGVTPPAFIREFALTSQNPKLNAMYDDIAFRSNITGIADAKALREKAMPMENGQRLFNSAQDEYNSKVGLMTPIENPIIKSPIPPKPAAIPKDWNKIAADNGLTDMEGVKKFQEFANTQGYNLAVDGKLGNLTNGALGSLKDLYSQYLSNPSQLAAPTINTGTVPTYDANGNVNGEKKVYFGNSRGETNPILSPTIPAASQPVSTPTAPVTTGPQTNLFVYDLNKYGNFNRNNFLNAYKQYYNTSNPNPSEWQNAFRLARDAYNKQVDEFAQNSNGKYTSGTPVFGAGVKRLYLPGGIQASNKAIGFNPQFKLGGSINFLQQGGALAYIQQLPKDKQQLLLQAFGQWALQKGIDINQLQNNPDALNQALEQFMQEMLTQQAQVAEKGAKLSFIKKLKGICPEGEELIYVMKAGGPCPICQKKKEGGKSIESKKQFFGKDKKVNKALMGVRLTLFPEATDSVTVREKIDSQGNGFRQETFPNDSVSIEMFGKRFPGFAGNYGNPKINVSPKGKKVITEGANLPVSLPDTLHGADSTYINNKYKEILNNKAKLDTTYKVPIVPMDKKGGKAQFFKKEPKAPLAKCGKKVMAKCGCKAKKKK